MTSDSLSISTCKICLGIGSKSKKVTDEGYHEACLKRLFNTLNVQTTLAYEESEFIDEAIDKFSERASISGVQKKVSIKLESGSLKPTDVGGEFILKPQPDRHYSECPANEHLSMQIGRCLGIDVAECGLVSFKEGQLAYITRRFDRDGNIKIHQEDLAQIMNKRSDDGGKFKYESSYEEAILKVLEASRGKHILAVRYIERIIFRYLIGDRDFHLKNISMRGLSNANGFTELTPDYDAVQTVMYLSDQSSYLGLEDGLFKGDRLGKKEQVIGFPSAADFIELCSSLGVSAKPVEKFLSNIHDKKDEIFALIDRSYLSHEKKTSYHDVVNDQLKRIFSEAPINR